MPIISKIGRKSFKTSILLTSMYVLLALGSVTMVYPFLLLVSGSTKSAVDTPDSVVIPPFLVNDSELYKKHMEGFFNESMTLMRACYQNDASAFRLVESPKGINQKLIDEWSAFLLESNLPHFYYGVSYTTATVSKGVIPKNLRKYKSLTSDRFGGDLKKLNAVLGTQFEAWSNFYVSTDDFMQRYSSIGSTPWENEYYKFKMDVPLNERLYFTADGFYKEMFLKSQYPGGLAQYNKEHGASWTSWSDARLSRTVPAGSAIDRQEWDFFVRNIIHPRWLRISPEIAPAYRAYLGERYGSIGALNAKYGAAYEGFGDIPPYDAAPPEFGIQASDWSLFLQGWKNPESGNEFKIPAELIAITGIDFIFRDWLISKYGDLEKLNESVGTAFKSPNDILPPQAAYHFNDFKKRTGGIRIEFLKRNHLTVFDYLFMHGRALINTIIYCALTIICSLVVNPLAAYALSRFKPPSTYKVLLFLMLTMAFPPVVTQIPNFLLLREFNLLNTFAALILPGLANGYAIFLLKGFFDSLPQELYESASIDGASEIRIFLQITMSLSKPILAVIALSAFTGAYGNFMMALLVCQDRSMWTIMPFLFELQQNSGQGVIFASLLVASVPTLIIFILCQNVIMRGIVVPVEK
ncbi:MAG TPA: hypothetical protein DET40_06805 [Lentisphaeria bacterium]|nr:MAG: hypothetical protein A2X45_07495 [Lentisphaerae bacterium GWF2_50_93]HCE43239.1 hypothetical protein [Lentisphaeria bacterium]